MNEPTAEQCSNTEFVAESDSTVSYAIWYPSMGGYVGKAIATFEKQGDSCVDLLIWHDGKFPFSDDPEDERQPTRLHHCDPAQFVRFGEKLTELMDRSE